MVSRASTHMNSKDHRRGDSLSLIRIINAKPHFKMPNGRCIDKLTGHIVFWHYARQFYSRPFVEWDNIAQPDCLSTDGIKPNEGTAQQSELCANCPNDQPGIDIDGRPGRSCRKQIRLYFLLEDQEMPRIINVGPFRLNNRDALPRWLTNITNQGGHGASRTVKVRLGLHTQQYDRFVASILDIETINVLDPTIECDKLDLARLDKLYKRFATRYKTQIACNTPSSEYWLKRADQLWRTLIVRSGCCAYCGKTSELEAHHLVSRINAITRHTIENGLCLCRFHHLYCPQVSPHQAPQAFARWLRVAMPDKHQWLREHERKRVVSPADYRKAFYVLLQLKEEQTTATTL